MNDIEHLIYKNYLAEQEMLNQLSILKVKSISIHETSEQIQLNEDVKEVVMNYIRKVIANIQEVWNKFKSTISSAADLKRIEPYKKYFNTDFILKIPEGFNIPILSEYQKMLSVKIPSFQESMLDELVNDKEFTRKYFGYFYDEKQSVKEVAESKVIKVAEKNGKDSIDKQDIAGYLKNIEQFKSNADEIANDIKNLNNSSRSIENLMNQSVNASASFEDTYQYYFNEGEEKESFNSVNKDEENSNNNNEDKKKDSDTSSKINTYFRICNSILSTKLSLTNKVRSSCTTLLIQFGKLQESNKQPEENKKEDNNQNTNINGSSEVKL